MATAKKESTGKASGKAVAVAAFVAITEDGYRAVVEGEELDASDEVVKANPDHFRKET